MALGKPCCRRGCSGCWGASFPTMSGTPVGAAAPCPTGTTAAPSSRGNLYTWKTASQSQKVSAPTLEQFLPDILPSLGTAGRVRPAPQAPLQPTARRCWHRSRSLGSFPDIHYIAPILFLTQQGTRWDPRDTVHFSA